MSIWNRHYFLRKKPQGGRRYLGNYRFMPVLPSSPGDCFFRRFPGTGALSGASPFLVLWTLSKNGAGFSPPDDTPRYNDSSKHPHYISADRCAYCILESLRNYTGHRRRGIQMDFIVPGGGAYFCDEWGRFLSSRQFFCHRCHHGSHFHDHGPGNGDFTGPGRRSHTGRYLFRRPVFLGIYQCPSGE